MNTILIIFILFLVLLGLGVWILLRVLKKKRAYEKSLRENIPQELLDIFNEAENMLKGGIQNGNTNDKTSNPYTILWEVYRRRTEEANRRERQADRTVIESNPAISNRELYSEPNGRQDIQTGTIESVSEDRGSIRETKPNSRRNIFSRLRRK
jgi:hypothetical protein